MRKVELRMKEEYKYKTIKKLVETNGNKKRAATKLESYSHLHIALDDSTGNIVGGYFDKEETLNGYYHVTKQPLLL